MDFHSVAHTPGNAVSGLGASRRQFSRSSDQVWNFFFFFQAFILPKGIFIRVRTRNLGSVWSRGPWSSSWLTSSLADSAGWWASPHWETRRWCPEKIIWNYNPLKYSKNLVGEVGLDNSLTLNNEHLKKGNIWITNFYLFAIEIPANSLLFKPWPEKRTKSLLFKPWLE